ncbi:MAG: hypothetical protein KDK69_06190 [Chlamydiia bacterium]|nr:hypothetical protein [Chlamydiia bacterium]
MSLRVECPILQDVTNNPAFVVPCGCKFDAAAITEWSQRDNRCPNDRTVMQQICLIVTQEPVIDRRVYLAPEKGARFRELQAYSSGVQQPEHVELFASRETVKELARSLLGKVRSMGTRVMLETDELFLFKMKLVEYRQRSEYSYTDDKNRLWFMEHSLESLAGMGRRRAVSVRA